VVTERWSEYLRKLMRIGHKVERIAAEELEAGLVEEVAFRRLGTTATTEQVSTGTETAEQVESAGEAAP
jgi:hypothetical protein